MCIDSSQPWAVEEAPARRSGSWPGAELGAKTDVPSTDSATLLPPGPSEPQCREPGTSRVPTTLVQSVFCPVPQ